MNKRTPKLKPEAIKSLTAFAQNHLEELWDDFDKCGTWVRHSDLPEIDAWELAQSGLIENERRRKALEDGAEPFKKEIKLYRDWWLESALEGDGDADCIPAYGLSIVRDDRGNEGIALILRTGYSFSVLNTLLEGVFNSEKEALKHMRKGGWCSYRE